MIDQGESMKKRYSVTLDDGIYDEIDHQSANSSRSKSQIISGLVNDGLRIENVRHLARDSFPTLNSEPDNEDELEAAFRKFQVALNIIIFEHDIETDKEIADDFNMEKLLEENTVVENIAYTIKYLLDVLLPELNVIS